MIYHRYAHQPWTNPTRYPGMTMGQWGTHFERTLTWWNQGSDWLRYQPRCQYMLQEGRFTADVLYYYGEGAPNEFRNKVISNQSPAAVLESLGVKPDFSAGDEEHIRYIHREISGADYYFVACSNPKGEEVECTFRVSGKTPEFWYPETGETETVPVYEEKDGLTAIPIRFGPAGSVFVVFRKPAAGDHAVAVKYTAAPGKPQYKGDLKMVKAKYGYFADEDRKHCANVTELVSKFVADGELTIIANDGPLKVDPSPGIAKQLLINYRVNGVNKQVRIGQPHSATLPRGAEIISAWYGKPDAIPEIDPPRKTVDITGKLAGHIKDGALTVAMNSLLAGGKDPAAL